MTARSLVTCAASEMWLVTSAMVSAVWAIEAERPASSETVSWVLPVARSRA